MIFPFNRTLCSPLLISTHFLQLLQRPRPPPPRRYVNISNYETISAVSTIPSPFRRVPPPKIIIPRAPMCWNCQILCLPQSYMPFIQTLMYFRFFRFSFSPFNLCISSFSSLISSGPQGEEGEGGQAQARTFRIHHLLRPEASRSQGSQPRGYFRRARQATGPSLGRPFGQRQGALHQGRRGRKGRPLNTPPHNYRGNRCTRAKLAF